MLPAPTPPNESSRLGSLRALDVLDTSPEERFDRITRLARRLFGVPIAVVSLVDADRQWFKSRQGVDASETPRDVSFCGHAILNDEILVVPDAARDQRFSDNPLVVGEPGIRFYAGCPLSAPDGSKIGTLCVIDREPHQVSEEDLRALHDLATMVERELVALELATTDPLTGLSNRRGFEALAGHTIALARRTQKPVTLFFMDLDRFKEINDELGHEAGDEALREMGALLLGAFRDSDVIARLGGDEFSVLMSGATEQDVATALSRLEERIRARNADEEVRFPLAYSVGTVSYEPSRHEGVADLMREADARMYQRKRERRAARAERAQAG